MSILDIVILVLLVLSGLWGLIRGFGRGTLRRLSFLLSLGLGYFIGIPIARGLMETGLGADWLTGLYLQSIPSSGIFAQSVAAAGSEGQSALLNAGLGELGFPVFFRGFFSSGACLLDSDVATALASSFAYYTLIAVLFVLFFVVLLLVFHALFKLVAEPLLGEDGKGVLGRILGMVRRLLHTSLIILALMAVVVLVDQLLMGNDIYVLHNWLFVDLGLGNGSFSLARMFYDTANALLGWVSQIGG